MTTKKKEPGKQDSQAQKTEGNRDRPDGSATKRNEKRGSDEKPATGKKVQKPMGADPAARKEPVKEK